MSQQFDDQQTFASPDNVVIQSVSQELRRDYKKTFVCGGTVCFEHFPAFTVRYPTINASQYPAGFVEFVAGNLTDRYTKETLEKEFRCLNWLRECTHLIPLYTTGDGNCLLHAASLAMWGFEDKQFMLRNALYESLTTADRNNNTLQDRCRMSVSSMLRDVQVNMSDNDWFLEWQQIVNQARPNSSGHHQSLEESHIFVLANILRRPIIIYGVPKVRSFNTGGIMQNINFHGIYFPLLWGSQLCHKPPLCLGYGMGHFTALVPDGNPQQQLVVPLTDNNGDVLPIRFLFQHEEQNTLYLLEQYLDVIQVFSSLLGKQIPVAVIALREAAHMQQLVQTYIDKSLTTFNNQNQPYYAQTQPTGTPQGELQHHLINNTEPVAEKCKVCKEFHGDVQFGGLCSVCFKKKSKEGSTAKPPQQRLNYFKQPTKQEPSYQPQQLLPVQHFNNQNEPYYAQTQPTGTPQRELQRHPINNTEPVAEKCKVCKEFHGDVQFGGLCSVCFKEKSKEKSTTKPPQQRLNYFKQPTKQEPSYQPQQLLPVQHFNNQNEPYYVQTQPTGTPQRELQRHPINNTEPVAEKCKVCKEFHGDVQFGGLCSVCFKEKSKEKSTAKPPQQRLNDFKQPAKQEPSYQPQQPLPVQQEVYNQDRANPPPVGGSQPQPTPFGYTQCINRGCVRAGDDQSQGYCTQCFHNNVVRHQQSQPNQQRPMGQQQDQQRQQDE